MCGGAERGLSLSLRDNMKHSLKISLFLGLLMMSSAVVTKALTPSVRMADTQAKFDLETMIPKQFGEWAVDARMVPLQVDPETQAKLDRIYNQTLSRTYVNRTGERVMLSLAYGGDQSDNTGLHRPEVCYAAQGFEVKKNTGALLVTGYGAVPIRRLVAVNGARHEPITYWITVGNKAINPGLDQRLLQLRMGLTGVVPDGILVRVSTITPDVAASYKVQDAFVNELLNSLDGSARARLIGVFGG